jgi:hypothetical protein
VTVLAGLFLIAHGLVHAAVWLAPPAPDAPFNPRHSWLIGDATAAARALAVTAGVLLALAGTLLVFDAGSPGAFAVAGAGVSLVLVVLTFNRWFVFAVAINIAIIVVALA